MRFAAVARGLIPATPPSGRVRRERTQAGLLKRHRAAALPDGSEACYSPAMIVRPRPTAFGLLFILRGSILPMIAPRLLTVLLVSAGVVWLHQVVLPPSLVRVLCDFPGWFSLVGEGSRGQVA